MDDLERLARRAAGGDLLAARRMVAALEERAGAPPSGGGIWIRAWDRNKRVESNAGWSNYLDLEVASLEYGPFSCVSFDNSTKGVMQLVANGRMIGWQPTNNPNTLWRLDAAAAIEVAITPPGRRLYEIPEAPPDMSYANRWARPAYVMRRMEFTDSRPA